MKRSFDTAAHSNGVMPFRVPRLRTEALICQYRQTGKPDRSPTYMYVGRDSSLVVSSPFVRSHHVGTLGKSFTSSCLWSFGVKLRNSIRAVSGAPLSSSDLEDAL